jgi:hypothetical protein
MRREPRPFAGEIRSVGDKPAAASPITARRDIAEQGNDMNGKSTLTAAALVAILAGTMSASASGSGGGGGAGDGPSQSYFQDLQQRTDQQARDLDKLGRQGRTQPGPAAPQQPGPQAVPSSVQGGNIPVAGGMIRLPASVGETLMPPGGPPSGWTRRIALQNGFRIYTYKDGSSYVVRPDGQWTFHP